MSVHVFLVRGRFHLVLEFNLIPSMDFFGPYFQSKEGKTPSELKIPSKNYADKTELQFKKDSRPKETCLKDQGHLDIRSDLNQKSVGEQAP